jgi:hypothetical protein
MRIGEQDANILEHAGLIFADGLGGFETPATGSLATPGEFILFVVVMFYVNLISLNALIAILGDSYDNVRAEENLFDMKEKAVLLKELNDFYFWNRDKEDICFMHIIRYVSENRNTGNVWEGKIKQISNMIKNSEIRVDSKLAKMDTKMDEIKR